MFFFKLDDTEIIKLYVCRFGIMIKPGLKQQVCKYNNDNYDAVTVIYMSIEIDIALTKHVRLVNALTYV